MPTCINIYVIGAGGIGGEIADKLPGAISSINLDLVERYINKATMQEHLENAGEKDLPSIIDRITLIDGDTFNERNAIRQVNGAGNKMLHVLHKMQDGMLRFTYTGNIQFNGINDYVTPQNIQTYIPMDPPENPWNADSWGAFVPLEGDFDRRPYTVIFLCVDNLKTRWEVSKYAESFDNILVINGGNKKESGHVTVYERCCGKPLDPNLYEVYTEVTPDADKRPDELACTYIAPEHDQVLTTNAIIACEMIKFFSRWAKKGLNSFKAGKNLVRKNEVIYDGESEVMTPLYHPK